MSEQFNRSVIRFFKADGQTVGTGFAISARYVMSCTHVVAGVLAKPSDQPLDENSELDAEVNLNGNTKIRLKVVKSLPRLNQPKTDDLEDVTILERVGGLDQNFEYAPVLQQADSTHYDQPFKTYGFNKASGDWHDGVCKGPTGSGWIQLQIDNLIADKLNGLSGAPVWNKQLQAITGMLVAKRRGDQDVYMIPVHKLAQAWPELKVHTHIKQLPDQPDSAFLSQVKQNIANELDGLVTAQFHDILKQELDKVLEILKQPKIAENRPELIADGLITALKKGDNTVPVITKVLTIAAMQCLDKKGKAFQASQGLHDVIKDTIEQILGWLVLASVDEQYVQDLNPSPDYPAVYFELPVVTPGGVEMIVSRRFQRQARLESKKSDISGCNLLQASVGQFEWKASGTVELLKRLVWNQVFPDEKKDTNLTANETAKLNAELEIRRSDEWVKEHHVLAIECETLQADEFQKGIYHKLLTDLNQLTLIRFGVQGQQTVFCIPEQHLMRAVQRFLNHINTALSQ